MSKLNNRRIVELYRLRNGTHKSAGDIQEKKMTLPLIYALDNASKSDKKHIIRLIKKYNDRPEKVKEVIQFVNQSGGLEYAKQAMESYAQKAFDLLHTFPLSPARQSLEDLVVFVTQRKK